MKKERIGGGVRSGKKVVDDFFFLFFFLFSFILPYPCSPEDFSGCYFVVAPVFRGSRCLIDLVQPLGKTTEGNQMKVLVQVVAAEESARGPAVIKNK